MLPDRSVLIGQKLVENAQIQKFKCDILGDFQILCSRSKRAEFCIINEDFISEKEMRWNIEKAGGRRLMPKIALHIKICIPLLILLHVFYRFEKS